MVGLGVVCVGGLICGCGDFMVMDSVVFVIIGQLRRCVLGWRVVGLVAVV